ncbi:GNAT family N-acetyltransferase [Sporosarcina sp. FA9]|uniref:GNAT family N-acetyltransferase n=1 Tax=Sporosarcina sp. FA9 TaxID=3413030 RepID=UPI003F65A97F
MITKHVLKNGFEISIKRLNAHDLDEIMSLQLKVVKELTTESFLQPLEEEEFLYILNGKGLMIGAFYNEELIAFRAMMEPELDEEHLGKEAGLDKSVWSEALYSEITNVNPEFRGNGLQVLLGKLIMKEVDEERFRYILTTVAPFNIASLKDKFAHGLEIVSLGEKYNNMLRYTMLKDLKESERTYTVQDRKSIAMANTIEQQLLIKKGWVGTQIEVVNDEWIVHFEKRKN